jgi:cytochrome c-type biogenesis protein CcmE
VARRRSPIPLFIALSVAALLVVFLGYFILSGESTASVQPSELSAGAGKVHLAGRVLGPVTGDSHGAGMRFTLRDVRGTVSVPVVYKGSVPDLFKIGRDVMVTGRLQNGTFVTEPGTMITKCPSKYTAEKPGSEV